MPTHPTNAPRAALYARISKDRLEEGLGVERQLKDLRRLCAERGWSPIEPTFVDNDVSASNPKIKRPAYERMLAAIEAGSVDVVVAWDDDRLVRQQIELERFFLTIDAAGASFATMSNTVDVGTGEGMLVARVKGAVAAEEVRKLSKRSRRKHLELAERGLPSGGGHRAYGYSCSRSRAIVLGEATCDLPGCAHDGVTVIEHEAEVIREAASRYLAGEGFRVLARWMNAAGARTSTGREWTDSVVRNMLVNVRLVGRRTHRGEDVGQAQWAAILDDITQNRIVTLSASRRKPGPQAPRKNLLTGVLRCSRCGSRLSVAPVNGRTAYRCQKKPGTPACGGLAISAAPVDEAVEAMVLYRLSSPVIADAMSGKPTPGRSDERVLLDEIEHLERLLADAAGMFATGEMSREQFLAASRANAAKLDTTRARLAATTSGARLADVTANAADIVEQWQELTFERRHAVIRSLIDRIEIRPGVRGSHTVDVERRVDVRWIA